MGSASAPTGHSRRLFDGPLVRVGRFDAAVSDPDFETAGEITAGHLLVFPGTPVVIEHAGRRPFVADPNVVVLYNRRQEYRRRKLTDAGDHCHWIAFREDVLMAALMHYEESVAERPEAPFRHCYVASDSQPYLLLRLIARHLEDGAEIDTLAVEEILLHILGAVASKAVGSASTRPGEAGSAREIAEQVKSILAANIETRITLDRIAKSLEISPFHLCRQFRAATGATVHRYHCDLRLRRAFEWLPEFRGNLTDLALQLGFSSHSHFTSAFRQHWGVPPRAVQCSMSGRRLRELVAHLVH